MSRQLTGTRPDARAARRGGRSPPSERGSRAGRPRGPGLSPARTGRRAPAGRGASPRCASAANTIEQPFPAVVVPVPGGAPHGPVAQPSDGIALGIELAGAGCRSPAGAAVCGPRRPAERSADRRGAEAGRSTSGSGSSPLARRSRSAPLSGWRQKAVAEAEQRGLDAVAQLVAGSDPSFGRHRASVRARSRSAAAPGGPKRLAWISSHSAAKSANARPRRCGAGPPRYRRAASGSRCRARGAAGCRCYASPRARRRWR